MDKYNTSVVLGLRWGDEGKGKLIDWLAQDADIVARFQGGPNAGHTIYYQGQKLILHLTPSGITNPNTICLIGPEVVLDPFIFMKEIIKLEKLGISCQGRLLVSSQTSLILDYHKKLDACRDAKQGIGTTKKGIGPAYEDLTGRKSIMVSDLFQPRSLKDKLEMILFEKNALLKAYGQRTFDLDKIHFLLTQELAEFFSNFVFFDVVNYINEAADSGKKILFEGAQGALLDVIQGTVPYVTSSHTIIGALTNSFGIAPQKIKRIIGVIKAYDTRVGSGPFPTEIPTDQTAAQHLQQVGKEFGSTTGRARRVGWLDLPSVRYTAMMNGVTEIALTKLDVLSGLPLVKLNNSYLLNGQLIDKFSIESINELQSANSMEFAGWKNFSEKSSKRFFEAIQDNVPAPIKLVSIGPHRDDLIQF